MAYWLLKSEPAQYPWQQLWIDGRTCWDGVRNPQALGYLRAMALADLAFFYHSNTGREIVGICRVVRTWYTAPGIADRGPGMVDVEPVQPLTQAVNLATIRATPALQGLALIRQARLSVLPVAPEHWHVLLRLSQTQL
jgi:predicted RNA-binding protein with PUA-like domain